jgi:hypothetical protein
MILQAQHAAGLRRLEERRQRFIGVTARHPIVEIAKGHDEIGRARGRDVVVILAEFRDRDLARRPPVSSSSFRRNLSSASFAAAFGDAAA